MTNELRINGIAASQGTGCAPLHLLRKRRLSAGVPAGINPEAELERFRAAAAAVREGITRMRDELSGSRDEWTLKLFDTHIYFVGDPEFRAAVEEGIGSRGLSAGSAVREGAEVLAGLLENSGSEEVTERAADLRDVAGRIVIELEGGEERQQAAPKGAYVLAVENLSPLDASALDPENVRGIITAEGGYSCHTAIVARSLGIPAVTGTGDGFERLVEACDVVDAGASLGGLTVVVDGDAGAVFLNPGAARIAGAAEAGERRRAETEALAEYRDRPTMSLDGVEVKLCAHLGGLNELEAAARSGADGIGLFRSEFLFIGAEDFPGEDQQFEAYRSVLEGMDGRRVVIRTLDIGGDKNVPYAGIEAEQNPFLGVRGIRYSLDNLGVFRTQLRALLRASVYGRLAIMIPMAAVEEEVAAARTVFDEEKAALKRVGTDVAEHIEFGMMIEVPSAALIADRLAKLVDFFSIGTNDLVQYTLAADRMNPAVAGLYQPMHPAVLKLIEAASKAAAAAGIGCAVCGEAASDPKMIPFLLKSGISELSVGAPQVLQLRKLISGITVGV